MHTIALYRFCSSSAESVCCLRPLGSAVTRAGDTISEYHSLPLHVHMHSSTLPGPVDCIALSSLRNKGNLQVIEVCERLAECDAQVNNVPVGVLKAARGILRSFQWARDAADRLAFAEVLATNEDFTAEMAETYKVRLP